MIDDALSVLGLPTATSTTRLAGYDAAVWRADLSDGRTVAVRVLRPGRSAERDLAALDLAARHTDLAPQVLASGDIDGRAVVALSWCAGRTIGDRLLAGGNDTADAARLGEVFGAIQRDLHRRVDGQVLCHLDYQPFNVLVDDAGVPTGIVDWGNARIADPREDLAWTEVVLGLSPAILPELAPPLPDFVAGWRRGYGAAPDLDGFTCAAARRQLADWEPRTAAGEVPAAVLEKARDLVREHCQDRRRER